MRRTIPLVPAILLGIALVVLGFGIADYLNGRGDNPNAADIGFYDDMTAHHMGALTLARSYARNGDDNVLRSVSDEIVMSQAGDIRVMQNALTNWDETGTPETAMEWMGHSVATGDMPGMATDADLAELAAARGEELDDLYTRLMIDHHAAGVDMAEAAIDRASVGQVKRLAEAMAFTQRREIEELNARRVAIGLPEYDPAAS